MTNRLGFFDIFRESKVLLFAIALGFPAYAFFQLSSINALSIYLLQEFPKKLDIISNLSSIYLLADAIFLIPAGFLLDRFPLKYSVTSALFLIILGLLLMRAQSSLFSLYMGRFIMGIGHSFSFLTGFKIMNDYFLLRHRSKLTVLVIISAMMGGCLAQAPLLLLVNYLHWQTLFSLNVVVGSCLLLLCLIVFDKNNFAQNDSLHVSPKQNFFLRPCKTKMNICIGIFMGFLNAPLIILGSTWGVHYLINVDFFSPAEAGYITSFIFIGFICGAHFCGWIADLGKNKVTLLYYALGMAMFICMVVFLFKVNIYFQMILFFLLSATCGSQVLGYVLVNNFNRSGSRSSGVAISNVFLMLVSALLPFSFNAFLKLSQHFGENIQGQLSAGMFVIPISLLISFLILFLCRHDLCS